MNPKKIESNRSFLQKIEDRFYPPIREINTPFDIPFEVNGKVLSWRDQGIFHTTYRVDLFGNIFDKKTTIVNPQFTSYGKDGKPNFYKVISHGPYGAPKIHENGWESGKPTGNILPTIFVDTDNNSQIYVLTEIDPDASLQTNNSQRRAVRASDSNVITGDLVKKATQPDTTITPIVPGLVRGTGTTELTNAARIVGFVGTGGVVLYGKPDAKLLNPTFAEVDKVKLKAVPIEEYMKEPDIPGQGAILRLIMDCQQNNELKIHAVLPETRK